MNTSVAGDFARAIRPGVRSGARPSSAFRLVSLLVVLGSAVGAEPTVASAVETSARQRAPAAESRTPAAGDAAAASTAIVVPFTFEKGQVVLEVMLGTSGPFLFLLDTGTNPSIIDVKRAEILAIPLGEASDSGSGAGTGAMHVRRCLLPALSLGSLTAVGLEAAAVDLTSLSAGFGRRIDGVLGYGFLKDRVLTIDYASRQLTFPPILSVDRSDLFRRGKGKKLLPFDFYGEGRTPCVRALSVAGSPALRVTIDTGSSGLAAVYHRTALKLGWKGRLEDAPIRRAEGYRGAFPSAIFEPVPISFAGFDLGPCEVSVPLPGSNYGEDGGEIAEGNVGNALLSGFRITFDYPGRVLLIEKVDPAPGADGR